MIMDHIQYERFQLSNGLKFIVHKDTSSPMVAFNVLYNVGARDEDENHTGFAHLFEHLMFGGSVNIPNFDGPLEQAGGENNAYTTNDITNFYIVVPKENMETAFWLESDRMLSLAFNAQSLEVQRKVVSEEFKEGYLNQPYGDAWGYLRSMAYQTHPYKWMTIGKELSHIERATLEEVKAFFHRFYKPNNAIIAVAGNVELPEVKALAEKYFGDIPAKEPFKRALPVEQAQTAPREMTVKGKVPLDALYKAWHIGARLDMEYYIVDIITELLGNGRSSRLYKDLVKEKAIFSHINCYHTGSFDPGLLVIEGQILEDCSLSQANEALEQEIEDLISEGFNQKELEKAKNKIEAAIAFEDMNLLSRANNLAYFELLGDAELMNKELSKYASVSLEDLNQAVASIFAKINCSTLFYQKEEEL